MVPDGTTARLPHGVRRHRSRDLVDDDHPVVGNLAVTTAARTIVDVAGELPVWRLEALHPLGVDIVVVGMRVAIECDGRAYHTSDHTFERDRRRWQLLKEAGWRIVWVTWRRLHETPHDVVAEVRREIRRQR